MKSLGNLIFRQLELDSLNLLELDELNLLELDN